MPGPGRTGQFANLPAATFVEVFANFVRAHVRVAERLVVAGNATVHVTLGVAAGEAVAYEDRPARSGKVAHAIFASAVNPLCGTRTGAGAGAGTRARATIGEIFT